VWLRRLLAELGYGQTKPTTIYVDNVSAIMLSQNPAFHKRSKHFEVQAHYVREKVKEGVISVDYIQSDLQLADIFTKPLHRAKHLEMKKKLGLVDVEAVDDQDQNKEQPTDADDAEI